MQIALTLPSLSETFSSTSQNTNPPASNRQFVLEQLLHDLRQPLCAIENHAYVLQLNGTDAADSCHLQAIQDLVAQAHSLLEQVAVAAYTVGAR
jgi:hypothetical protein